MEPRIQISDFIFCFLLLYLLKQMSEITKKINKDAATTKEKVISIIGIRQKITQNAINAINSL